MSSSNITDIEVANAPELSGGGPPSVPSQILVVLVDEANTGGTPRLRCPRDDQDIRLLTGVAKPASVTVYDDSLGSPCIGGMLSSSDIAGRLLSVVPAAISFTVGPTDPANPNNLFITNNPIGPSDSDPAGPAGPYVAGGRLSLTMLARLASMVRLALLARLGHCLYLTVTLLVRLACMLQGALLAQMGCCPRLSLTLLAHMLQVTLLARLGPYPRLTPVL